MNKTSKGVCISMGVILFVTLIVYMIYGFYVDYQYERDIGAYFDNARDCITPECILVQLNDGKQAIVDYGLTEDMYGALIFKKPDNSMKFQFQHLDAIIERAEAVKIWKEKSYSDEGVGETMKDVYNEKMDNLRKYIHAEGARSDWIAKSTWYVNNHKLYYLWYIVSLSLLVLIVLLFIVTLSDSLFY